MASGILRDLLIGESVPGSVLAGRHIPLEAPILIFLVGHMSRIVKHLEQQALLPVHEYPQIIQAAREFPAPLHDIQLVAVEVAPDPARLDFVVDWSH
jgi:hypothetical protein